MDYLILPFVEFEIRLGTLGKHNFDSSVDKRHFEKIKSVLESGSWVSVVTKDTTEFVKENYKLIDKNHILKENIIKKDFQINVSPFDVRFSVNQEFSLKSYPFTKDDYITRIKKRKSFISESENREYSKQNQA